MHKVYLNLEIRSFVLQRVLREFPAELPNRRELEIQLAKLQRLISATYSEEPWTKHLQTRSEKAKKEAKQHFDKTISQNKKFNDLLFKSFKKFVRDRNPRMTNRKMAEWNTRF